MNNQRLNRRISYLLVAALPPLLAVLGVSQASSPSLRQNVTTPCQSSVVILPGGKVGTKDCTGKVSAVTDTRNEFKPLNLSLQPQDVTPSQNMIREQEDYIIWSFQQSRRLYEWQHRSSIIIFFVVILLVLSGVYFAALQFHHSLNSKEGKTGKSDATEIDASLKGFKAKSSVLGVIILTISMAFLYLYLVHVYPIHDASYAAPSDTKTK